MSEITNGKDLKPGDKFLFVNASGAGEYLMIRKVKSTSVIKEKHNIMITKDHIVMIDNDGNFGAYIEDYNFNLIERLGSNLQFEGKVDYNDLKPGDIFGGGPNNSNIELVIAINHTSPGETFSELLNSSNRNKEGLLYRSIMSNDYFITNRHDLYKYKSSFSNAVLIQTNVFDTSMWGGTCLLCGAPSHQGLIGKPQCSSEKCILH